ncbi:MAG: peptidase M64 [Sphingobacteriales bacterium]|nr:peptidase M64 [Sphingobacteriales bacterium]
MWHNKLIFALFFLLSYRINAQSPFFSNYFDTCTLRLDFVQTGNYFYEKMETVRFLKEPYWGGSYQQLIDHFGYGNYFIKVFDLTSGQLIYSRGFGSIFQEWRLVPEAREEISTYQLSVNIPFPLKPVKIEVYSRDSMNLWVLLNTFHLNPDTLASNQINYRFVNLRNSGKPSEKVDIVIIPDGYRKREKRKMLKDARNLSEWVLSYSPLKEHKNRFNIKLVIAFSEDSGCDDPNEDIFKNTVVHTHFNTLGSDRYLMTDSVWKLHDIASVVPYDQIIIMTNSSKYGGGAIYNYYATCTSGNPLSGFVVSHEFGHSFAGLADEYEGDSPYTLYFSLSAEPWEPNITTLVDFNAKWKNMIDKDIPIPTPVDKKYSGKLGVFEGAGYLQKGVYRPVMDCTMRSISPDNFCPVCRKAIMEMINFYSE